MSYKFSRKQLTTLLTSSGIKDITDLKEMLGGNTSTVYQLTRADGQRFVLKLVDDVFYLRAEALCLDVWRQAGISTPTIHQVGVLPYHAGDIPFLLLEFMEGENLLDLLENERLPAPDILQDLGLILARMHQVKSHGFGKIVFQADSFRGEFDTFRDERQSTEFQEEIAIDLHHGRISQEDVKTIEGAIHIVDEHAAVIGPSLVHTDFRAGNIIYNPRQPQPYIVIDPSPRLTHPYMCLAYALVLEKIHTRRNPDHFLAGYTKITPIHENVLTAAILLITVSQLSRWGHPDHPYANNLKQLFRQTKTDLNNSYLA